MFEFEWMTWLVIGAVFLGVFCLVIVASTLMTTIPDKAISRMDGLIDDRDRSPSLGARLFGQITANVSTGDLMRRLLPDDETRRTRLTQRLVQAGYYEPAALGYFMMFKVIMMVVPIVIAVLATWVLPWPSHWTLMIGALLGFVGMLVPDMYLASIIRRRQRVFRQALPDFVDLAVTCVEGGMGLSEAVAQVHAEMRQTHPLLAVELDFVLRDVQLGQTLGQGFHRMSGRTGIDEARALSSFIDQSQRFGSEMGSALRELSDMLRFQREQRAEELAQQASVKILIPTLLFIFPVIFVVLAGPAALQIQKSFQEMPTQVEKRGQK
ncbi:type II secretion system F family protein [Bremerella cremea]|uniref:type II secretion system F family protein n=1 Tax=Bremerella cremea TaxID=1031537 RepID=UPI0031EA4A9B